MSVSRGDAVGRNHEVTPSTTPGAATVSPSVAENYQRYFVPVIGEPLATALIEAVAPQPGERVLDVACGTGVAARLASERVGPEITVRGVDPNPDMLAVASRLGSQGIEWVRARSESTTCADHSFDVVVCSLGLQFFEEKPAALAEMRRVLDGGGRAGVATVGPTPSLLRDLAEALRSLGHPEGSNFVDTVFSLHDPDEIRALMETAGFDQVEVHSVSLRLGLPPPGEFLWQLMSSTPLAAAAAQMDDAEHAALEQAVLPGWQARLNAGVFTVDMPTLIATARA